MDAFLSGEGLKVNAFAGAGKTSTLVQMADLRNGAGLYIAFNKAIAEEARREFLPSTDCRTTHSVALHAIRASHRFHQNKLFTTLRAKQLATMLDLKEVVVGDELSLSDVQQAHLFLGTVRRFCQSADDEILEDHMPRTGRLLGLPDATRAAVASWGLDEARALWCRMIDAGDELPLGHDGYLKLWALSEPVLEHEYILLDEAQDTNPCVMRVLERQQGQVVYVGDQHQQIYEWRGAVNAMERVQTARSTHLTQSFRFGDAIADAATGVLRTLGESRPVLGNPSAASRVQASGDAGTVLTRTNAAVIAEVIEALERGRKPHIVGGPDEMLRLVGSVYSLVDGRPAAHPDFFGFRNWDEVVAFAETEEGEELRAFVGLVGKHGVASLYRALKSVTLDEAEADLVVSTAHKAKGCEWPSVRIADDFAGVQTKTGALPLEETRLFYVAITRAKERLVVSDQLLRGFQRRRLPLAEGAEASHRAALPERPPTIASVRPTTTPTSASNPSAPPVSMGRGPTPAVEAPAPPPSPAPMPPAKKGWLRRLFGA